MGRPAFPHRRIPAVAPTGTGPGPIARTPGIAIARRSRTLIGMDARFPVARTRCVASALAVAALLAVTPAQAAPDEELLGKSRGYPVGTRGNWFFEEGVRVGSFSHLDTIFPAHTLARAAQASPLPRAAVEPRYRYRFGNEVLGLDDYLARQRVTGLMVIKDGEVQVERYQYERTAAHRLLSNSIAKSVVSLAMGIALAEGKVRSLDDKAADYLPELRGKAYGETRLRNLLRMASGVKFSEVYDGRDDLARWSRISITEGALAGLRAFEERDAAEGERFKYASIETVVLAMVLRAATGGHLADYVTRTLWQPMGAEADATWLRDAQGVERAHGNLNAVLRDWGRLGVLLANDGMANGRQIVPRDYLVEATTWQAHPAAFAPRRATPYFGYGYQFWTYPGEARRFVLLGVYGQAIFVDPALKLVMVHLAVAKNASAGKESMGAERDALWQGLLRHYGGQ